MKIRYILIALIISYSNLLSQGLNNHHTLDSVDFREVFNLLGIDVFKFPFGKTDNDKIIKFSLQDYENGKLMNSFQIFSLDGLPDKIKNEFQLELNLKHKDILLRVYSRQHNDSAYTVSFSLNFLTQKYELISDPKEGMHQWRAYSNFQPESGKQIPFLIRYGVLKNTPMMSCPGDTPLSEVIKMYPFVLAFIVELE